MPAFVRQAVCANSSADAFELQGRAACRLEERQVAGSSQLAAQRDDGQRFFRREVRRRKEMGTGDVIPLQFVVEVELNAGAADRIEIAKDRPPAPAARGRQIASVVPPARLQQAENFQKPADARKTHGAVARCAARGTRRNARCAQWGATACCVSSRLANSTFARASLLRSSRPVECGKPCPG